MPGPLTTLGKVSRTGWLASLLLCLPAAVHGAEADKLERGKSILQEKCARCHAVEAAGESPLKLAPPMREIYARYAPRELQAELMEGMVSRHKEMPQVDFSEEDASAILVYLYALATRK
jgi:mono/diheme cytochrome c family protein